MTDDQRALLKSVTTVEQAITEMIDALEQAPGTDRQRLTIARVHARHMSISLRNSITNGND